MVFSLNSDAEEHEPQVDEPERANSPLLLPLAIAGMVALFLIVGGVLLYMRSKPKETANDATDITAQGGEEHTPSKTTERSKPKTVPPIPVKPKEPDPKPKEPEPKEPEKTKDFPPVVKEPAILTPRWSMPLETEGLPAKLYLDSEAQIILAGNERTPLLTLDLATGMKRPTSFSWFGLTGGNSFCSLDGGRVAKCLPDEAEILSWELKTGKTTEKYPVPKIASGTGKAVHIGVHLSPNGRYLAVARCGAAAGEFPSLPLCVYENKKSETMLFSTSWMDGSMHFNATSSRLLVAERSGRFRRFRLPSGDLDGEWDYGPPTEGRSHTVTAISRDGSTIGYNGPAKSQTESGPCLVDGKTGEVLHRFDSAYREDSPVVLSEDGRRAALLQTFTGDDAIVDVVTVPKGDVVARAKVPTKRSIPTFSLSYGGDTLLIHDAKSGKLWRFDLPAGVMP
jgi:hypothetical protein